VALAVPLATASTSAPAPALAALLLLLLLLLLFLLLLLLLLCRRAKGSTVFYAPYYLLHRLFHRIPFRAQHAPIQKEPDRQLASRDGEGRRFRTAGAS
jgi:hypothetical protein